MNYNKKVDSKYLVAEKLSVTKQNDKTACNLWWLVNIVTIWGKFIKAPEDTDSSKG